jgi:hypothetical protein
MTAPTPDTDNGADPGAAAPDTSMDQDSGDDQGMVLCTIMKNPDGGYTLIPGDEDDSGEGGDEGAGGDEMGGDQGAKPEGQTFDDPGQLLKAVLDILNKDAEASGGGSQANFEAGFSGDNSPTPKKSPPPKY